MSKQVNSQIVNAIEAIQQATMTGDVTRHAGAGKAYQSVALSSAIAIQDATDNLRNMGVVAVSAASAILAEMVESGDVEKYSPMLEQVSKMLDANTSRYSSVLAEAAKSVQEFPVGD